MMTTTFIGLQRERGTLAHPRIPMRPRKPAWRPFAYSEATGARGAG